jgi:colanic acid/amylovoran biosynthesis glycosyltransferase
MKIGLIFTSFPSTSETFLLSKINGLKKSGYKVILFGRGELSDYHDELILHPKLGNNFFIRLVQVFTSLSKLLIKNPLKSIKYLKLEKKDGVGPIESFKNLYINSHLISTNLDWIHFCFCSTVIRRENVAKAIGAKMSISLRGYDISIYPLKNRDCYSGVWNKLDKVHSISNSLLSTAVRLGLNLKIPTMIINPAIDVNHFSLEKTNDKKFKNTLKFLTVSRLHWIKGLEYTLEALSILKINGYNFNYDIIGDGPELERLKFARNQLKLNENVNFIGYLEHKKIKDFYRKSDIYLQYSIQEGFCNSLLEAQSMELICIGSNAEGLNENILNSKTGYIVEKRNPFKLYQQIKYVLNQKDGDLDKMRKNAKLHVLRNFDIKNQSQYFVSFFQK